MFVPQSVLDTGKKLSDDNTIGQEEIQQRLAHFVHHWQELKDLSGARYTSGLLHYSQRKRDDG